MRFPLAAVLPLLVCACALPARAVPAPFELHEEPSFREFHYASEWGSYLVTVERLSDVQQHFRIADRAGRVLRGIRAPVIHFVRFANLTGHGPDGELLVQAAPMHNTIADRRLYAFTRRPRLRNILALPQGYDELRDLDHDGRAEILLDAVYPFEWALGGHESPTLAMVLRWERERFVLRTQKFPAFARATAAKYRDEFLKDKSDVDREEMVAGSSDYSMRVSAAGYWVNRAALGEGRAAWQWLAPKLLPGERSNLYLDDLRQRLRDLPNSIRTDQRRTIILPW